MVKLECSTLGRPDLSCGGVRQFGAREAHDEQAEDDRHRTNRGGTLPTSGIRLTAACEVLAAIGLILPGLLKVAPLLTPLAAVGLMVVMVGAAISHRSLHEYPQVGLNLLLFLLALFVVIGRT